MDNFDVLKDVSERTGGDIYLGVVGPVRTGKSTFIKRFMEIMVLPNIADFHERERALDELPQSGAGRTVMTSEPKFVPAEAVNIPVSEGLSCNVRLVDCVGYAVEGALGFEEEDGPRMVSTPWHDQPMPFIEAAELGTRKVITDHSTIGLVILSDGSIGDIERQNFLSAEQRVIEELQALGKPYVIILNSLSPESEQTQALAEQLAADYGVTVIPANAAKLSYDDLLIILNAALYEFPVSEVNINLPRWIEELPSNHWLRRRLEAAVNDTVGDVKKVRDLEKLLDALNIEDITEEVALTDMALGSGIAAIGLKVAEDLFYRILSELVGEDIDGEHHIMQLMHKFSQGWKEWDKMAEAMNEVNDNGYGVVSPRMEEIYLEEPELIKQGGHFGVRLKASAPSYHIIRANITTEITPLIGSEKQCEDLVRYILNEFEDDPQKIWNTNVFGKSLSDLVSEGISGKLYKMPENVQEKLQETLQKIVNDSGGGIVCIII